MAIEAHICPENLSLPLGGSQDWLMDNNNNNNNNFFLFNGCGLNELSSFNLHQKQQQLLQFHYQQQQQQQQRHQQQRVVQFQNPQQRNQNPPENDFVFLSSSNNNNNNNNNAPTCSTNTTTSSDHRMNISHSLAAHLDKQRRETDRYITLQNERLKLALQEESKRHFASILRKLEAKAMALLNQKDDEVCKAKKRRIELEECVRKMEVESEAWQRVAEEKEAMVVSLSNTLEQVREQQGCCFDDAQSCCDDNEAAQETGIAVGGGERNMNMNMMICRFCNSRNSCMLLLPCRHLSSCKACDPFVHDCPLCRSPKTTSVEALFS